MAQRADFRIKKDAAKHLSSFLVTNGLITAEQLDQAVTASNESDRGLIETILEFGFTVEACEPVNEISYIGANPEVVQLAGVDRYPHTRHLSRRL